MQWLSDSYWFWLNDYDLEELLSLLEDSYRVERTEPLRDRVNQLKRFRVKLKPKGETPPYLTGPNSGEQFLMIGSPLGERRVWMTFHKVGDEWKITHAEETD